MNYFAIIYVLGWLLSFEATFLALPCIVAIIYREEEGFGFFYTMILCIILGIVLIHLGKRTKNSTFYAKEGFVIVGLCWIVMSAVGAIPFYINKDITSYIDALFETVSGFTTTGTTILSDIESLSQCSLFWRSFAHWIGGMGVLVFILAILPMAGGQNMHLVRAESPGPNVGKLVPKVRTTALILYSIYVFITIMGFVFLLLGKMPVFDALTTAFSIAGTGGFGIKNNSMGSYSPYIQTVTSVFMILFGVNFGVYHLILIRKLKHIIHAEEVKFYFGIILTAVIMITLNVKNMFPSLSSAFHHVFFQVVSIITTTGFSTTDYNQWPEFSKMILFLLMFIGACAGSTGGGIKISRILIAFKMIKQQISLFIHPRSIKSIKLDQRVVDQKVQHSVAIFLITYLFIYFISVLLLSLDNTTFSISWSAVTAAINNIGPGFDDIGPLGNFGLFSPLSKFVLMFDMLAGRLELFPVLVLFSIRTWRE